jgi:hypothetical protein
MAVFNSEQIARGAPIGGVGEGGGARKTARGRVTLPIGATTTDTIPLFFLPPNCSVSSIIVKSDALGGATTLNIGDLGVGTAIVADNDRYLAANNITTAGGVVTTMATTGVFFRNTTQQRLLVQAVLAAGTVATAGVLEVEIVYITEEPQP